jgi:hypothetical protein
VASTLFQDAFTDTAGTALSSHTPTVDTSWAAVAANSMPVISDANRARGVGGFFGSSIAISNALGTSDFDVSGDFTVLTVDSYAFLLARSDTAATFYLWGINGGSSILELTKCIAGSFTQLVTVPWRGGVGGTYPLRLRVEGSNLRGYLGGQLLAQTTDTAITTGTRVGLRFTANAGLRHRVVADGRHGTPGGRDGYGTGAESFCRC